MKLRALLSASALLALSGAASAATIRMDLSTHPANGMRGQYTATVLSGFAGMTDVTGIGSSFDTFCLEKNEYFIPGNNYEATIDIAARNGGVSGGVNGADPISPATAYLYTQFRAGNLGFSSFTNASDSAALQDAFWYLEGEISSVSGQALALVNQALAAGWTDIGDVRVMNIIGPNGSSDNGNAQSQLTMVPLPAAVWAGIAGFGGVVLHSARRRRALNG